MFRRSIIGIFALAIVGATESLAQTTFKTIEDVWKYADAHNISIRSAEYETAKAGWSTKQAYSSLLPQVGLSGSFTENTAIQTTLIPAVMFGGPEGQYKAVQFGQRYIYTGGINAQMDLLNMQNWLGVNIAKVTEEYTKATAANTRKTIYQQIATQYYSYMLMSEAARLAAQSEAIADSIAQTTINKYNEGNVSAANVDVAKINLNRTQQTAITAAYQLSTAKNNLKALLGIASGDSLNLEPALKANKSATISSFAEDPAVRQALLQSQISLGQYRAANAAFLPIVTVLYNNATQQFDNTFRPFQGGPAWFPSTYWSLRATWTLFNGGGRWTQNRKNKIGVEQTLAQYQNTQNQSALNDDNLRLAYEKASKLLQKSEEIMNLSYDNYMHITNRYNAGIEPLNNRLTAFTEYINYQNQYLNSLSEMMVQLYQVKIRQTTF
jgi:outer membrane protein TolC